MNSLAWDNDVALSWIIHFKNTVSKASGGINNHLGMDVKLFPCVNNEYAMWKYHHQKDTSRKAFNLTSNRNKRRIII